MRIAQVAPLWERVPPSKYGGVEMGVSLLTEGLLKLGHDVTLFASGMSKTKAKLKSVFPKPLYRARVPWTNVSYPYLNLTSVFKRASDFDIIHVHLCLFQDYLALPFTQFVKAKVVFTTRSVLPDPASKYDDRKIMLDNFSKNYFVSISNAQRKGWKKLNWIRTIYNGIDISKYSYSAKGGEYLVWVGKIRLEKGIEDAIKAALKTGEKLLVVGPIDINHPERIEYWKKKVEPHVDGKQIIYKGELTREQIAKVFQKAKAFINPIKWDEAFGLVNVESQACGTPVIAYKRGSSSEVIKDGKTGFVVENFTQMVKALNKVDQIRRKDCHEWAASMFNYKRMVDEYEDLYRSLIRGKKAVY